MVDPDRTPRPLLVAITIYGLLYLILVIDSFGSGQMISSDPNFDPWSLEMAVVRLQFVVFLAGYLISWKNGTIAGLIFVLCFILMCGMAYWVSTILHKDTGMTIVMAFPLLVMGVFFMTSRTPTRGRL
jgi:uncharacterized membrane protein